MWNCWVSRQVRLDLGSSWSKAESHALWVLSTEQPSFPHVPCWLANRLWHMYVQYNNVTTSCLAGYINFAGCFCWYDFDRQAHYFFWYAYFWFHTLNAAITTVNGDVRSEQPHVDNRSIQFADKSDVAAILTHFRCSSPVPTHHTNMHCNNKSNVQHNYWRVMTKAWT